MFQMNYLTILKGGDTENINARNSWTQYTEYILNWGCGGEVGGMV